MNRTLPLLKNTVKIVEKQVKLKKGNLKNFKLVPGKVRYPFNISYGGIYEGIYANDSIIYEKKNKKT